MHRNNNSHPKKRQIVGIIVAGLFLLLSIYLMIAVPPSNVWIEVGVVTLISVWIFFLSAWATKSKKWGGVITLCALYLLIMNRIGYLNWISFGVLLVMVGLISLIN